MFTRRHFKCQQGKLSRLRVNRDAQFMCSTRAPHRNETQQECELYFNLAVSRIRCKLIQYTQHCFTITSDMAEISNWFKVIFVCVVSLYSSTVEKKSDNRIQCHRQLPELPSVNGPNPALCEAPSSSGLCNVTANF